MATQTKKHYAEETIILQNGDEVTAKNLPISKLKLFHKEFSRWSDIVKKNQELLKAFEEEAQEKSEGDEAKAEKILEQLIKEEEDRSDGDELTYVDVASDCALIALRCWKIRGSNNRPVEGDAIDLEYVQDNVDMVTLDRILQVAGAITIGDVNELEGKPRG